jgi:juvenile hormone diol kinase
MLTKFQTRKWTHLFNIYDTDNSGVVTKEDFELKAQTIAKLLQIEQQSAAYNRLYTEVIADWEHLQKDADQDGDGQVTLEEWLAHGYTRITSSNMYETCQKEAKAVFELFDQNGDGLLSRQEYCTLIKAWGVSDQEVEVACSKVGLGEDNTLTKEQLVQLLGQFHKSDDPDSPGNYMFGSF